MATQAPLSLEERQALHENRREVMLGQVMVAMGVASPEQVFPSKLPEGLPPPLSLSTQPVMQWSKGWGIAAKVKAIFGVKELAVPERIVRPVDRSKIMLSEFPTNVDMSGEGAEPKIDIRGLSEETIKAAKKIAEPLEGIIRRLRALTKYREESYGVAEKIPCSPERIELFKCYHYAMEAGGKARDPNSESWRAEEVLSCVEETKNFLRCAGMARERFVQEKAME
eukprot:TRINITY_DN39543_c0_g1_i1.p1 TRINITY_DN39543_c0_g1~~TRINITY_DN39543_c0_g1_i1.p1  ORF type:complete len:225 (+),score=43.32 TRINITY_DN39543_c0_g1_i1:47-721(+)